MAEWIYFLHPSRDDFAATLGEDEQAASAAHAGWLGRPVAVGGFAPPELRPYRVGFLRGRA